MNVNHLISDTIARIKNGFVGHKNTVSILKSKQTSRIIEILEQEGFIRGYLDNKNTITVQLKYLDGKSVIHNFKVISTPGERMYFGFKDLIDWKNETNSFEMLILSTTQGIFADHVVLEKGLGGEVLCIIK